MASPTERSSSLLELLSWILRDPRDRRTYVRDYELSRRLSKFRLIRLIITHEQEIIEAFNQAPNPHGAAPDVLLQACYVGSIPLVELLLPICGTNFADANRETPLMRAALGGQVEVLQFLLARVPDHALEIPSLLQSAVRGGSSELLEWFIELLGKDFDVNSTDNQGETLLRTAISNDRVAVAAVLLAHGASGLEDIHGNPPSIISLVRSVEMARVLLASGADFSGSAGRDAVLNAVRQGDTPLVEFLLEHGADIRETPYADTSCTHEASQLGKCDIVELFAANGVDLDMRLKYGRTPLHQAAACGREDVVRILLRVGADLHARDREGKTALFLALGSAKVREILRRANTQGD